MTAPKTTDYCIEIVDGKECGESPESGTHWFGHHPYKPPKTNEQLQEDIVETRAAIIEETYNDGKPMWIMRNELSKALFSYERLRR